MRFDDSLRTVLQSDSASGLGARSTWRQLVDLAGRGRVATEAAVLARLRMLRPAVPIDVRAASARALAQARPDAALVGLFAEDELVVAAPVLRAADLPAADWIALLPRLSPPLRSVLRHRRDLDPAVARALASFGACDFRLPRPERGTAVTLDLDPATITAPPPDAEFGIAELVARIEAFRNGRDGVSKPERPAPEPDADAADAFRFETDAAGMVIGAEGVARGALVGLSIAHSAMQGVAQLDGVPGGAFRRRSRFDGARLEVGGASTAAGSWRLSAVPAFDDRTGRFTGFRGVARRPRADESAERPELVPSSDSLRQLMHELRTPTTAIAGFAELIETELLGPVPDLYRERAASIRARAGDLLAAIDDLDVNSRIQMRALELRPGPVALRLLIERVVADLAPLATMRAVGVVLDADDGAHALADDRAAERLLARLFATLVAAGSAGEVIRASVRADPSTVEVAVDRPQTLQGLDADALLALAGDEAAEGAPLLGTGFALRVARNLAAELGGALEFGPDRLTLRLPAVVDGPVEYAKSF